MSVISSSLPQRLVLDCVSWERYTQMLRALSDRHLRMTYDRGRLEIMTLSHEHENTGRFLGRLVLTLTEELNLPVKDGGSTTFRRRRKQKGLEPDDCFWIANETAVRGKVKIDLRKDPPPDVAMEVDISRSSMNRMRIYEALGIPEVWRYDKTELSFHTLNAAGGYDVAAISSQFPLPIAAADLWPFIQMRGQMDENAVIREFRTWIRAKIAAGQTP